MKKAVLLVVLFLIVSSIAVSADISADLTDYSVDELLELQAEINQKLYEKNELTRLPFGEYVAGRDIAVGRYIITPHNNEGEDWNSAWRAVIYKNQDSKAGYEQAYNEYENAYFAALKKENNVETVEYPLHINKSDYTSLYRDVGSHEELSISLEEGEVFAVERVYDDVIELAIEKAPGGLFME